MLVLQFPYMEIVWLALFFDRKNFCLFFSTIHRILFQNKKKVLQNFDGTVFAKCMKFGWYITIGGNYVDRFFYTSQYLKFISKAKFLAKEV